MEPAKHLRTYTVAELERIAHDQLSKLTDGFSIPVDVEHIVESLPNVDFDYYPGLRDNYNLEGMIGYDRDTSEVIIYIDEKLATLERFLRRYRMTVAEELAHLILHRKAIESVREPNDFRKLQNLPNWYEYERNAKKLAAMILMPSANILEDGRQLYHEMVSHVGFNNPEAIQKHLANILADRYEVSVQAMKFRLREWPINVIDKIDRAMKDKLDFLE
ncbi:MAG: ImmA/IrrE family metallo-endopeptidase [Planctomycetota bacterium]